MLIITFNCRNILQHISLQYLPSYSAIKVIVSAIFKLEDFILKYIDHDGDLISITSDLELQEAYGYYVQKGGSEGLRHVEMLLLVINVSPVESNENIEVPVNDNDQVVIEMPETSEQKLIQVSVSDVDDQIVLEMPDTKEKIVIDVPKPVDIKPEDIKLTKLYPKLELETENILSTVEQQLEPLEDKKTSPDSGTLITDQIQNAFNDIFSAISIGFQTLSEKISEKANESFNQIQSDWRHPDESIGDYLHRLKEDLESLFKSKNNDPEEVQPIDNEILSNVSQDNIVLQDLQFLEEMGFNDVMKNLNLLEKYQGDINRVVVELTK